MLFRSLGDWRVAAAVLFESESLSGNSKPSRKKRQEVTTDAEGSVGATSTFSGHKESRIADVLETTCGDYSRADGFVTIIDRAAKPLYYESHPNDSIVNGPKDVADTVSARYGTGGGNTPLVQQPIAFKVRGGCEGGGKGYLGQEEQAFTISTMQDQQIAQPIGINGNIAGTIDANYFKGCGSANFGERDVVAQPIAVDTYNQTMNEHTSQTIGSSASDVNHYGAVLQTMAIRRLTPKECERLQGFPDDWTKIPYRNKPADQCPDGPRYKACGNSMAVPVMRWIGERIKLIESML